MNLFIVRHGSTELNEQNALRGWVDVPLSEMGKKQAQNLAAFFKDIKLKAVYTSDLIRCQETAQIAVSGKTDITGYVTENLRPINFGSLQGRPYSEIQPELDKIFKAWQGNSRIKAPDGESFNDFQERIFPFVHNLFVENDGPDENILVVTHVRDCIYLAALAMNAGNPLEPADIKLLGGSEIETGNFLLIKSNYPAQPVIFGINQLKQISEPPKEEKIESSPLAKS